MNNDMIKFTTWIGRIIVLFAILMGVSQFGRSSNYTEAQQNLLWGFNVCLFIFGLSLEFFGNRLKKKYSIKEEKQTVSKR